MKTIKIESSSEIPKNFTGIIEWADGTRYWYKEGLFHRENGPGVEYKDGTKRWYKEGNLHREDGPACEWWDGEKHWFKDGKRHREDGPAIEWVDGTKEWWVEGKAYGEIILKHYVILDYDKGKYDLIWYKILGKDEVIDYPDIPGLITK